MTNRRLLIGASILVSGCFIPLFGQPTATQPAPRSSDPNWIGPRSWERHFTIPTFVATSKGLTKKVVSSQPSSYGSKGPVSYWASRQRRTSTEATKNSTSTAEPQSRTGRYAKANESGSSGRSSRSSEGRSSRRERRSRDDY
jgi:hypothetical protein